MTAFFNQHLGNGNGDGFALKRPDGPAPGPSGGSMPPYNTDIELALLGMLMHDPEELHGVLQILAADDFFRDSHRLVFAAIKARYDGGAAIDFRLVSDDLEAAGQLAKVGGPGAFAEMSEWGCISCNAEYYAQILRQLSIARKLGEAAEETRLEAYARQHTAEDLLARAEERIFAIAQAQSRDDTVSAATVADEAWEILMRRAKGHPEGVTTGLLDLDRIITCIPNGGLTILAARPAMGKTALALNICEHNVFHSGLATLLISLEMKRQDLGIRLLASQARVSGRLLKRPHRLLRPEHGGEMERLIAAREAIKACSLFINHTPGRTVAQIAANARLSRARDGIGLVVIDYMSLINMQARKGESRQEEVARTSRQLKDLARMLNIPVLVLCQLNRSGESREDRRPRMSDLRESGQIEADADLILLLHRPEYYAANDRPGEADILVAKNRNGETGRARLAFSGELTRFDNLAHPAQCNDEWTNAEF